MDTFIDKIAQKRNAQEMIRANMTAEAVKMEQMENQMREYDALMQEIRQVNLKTATNVSELQEALKECISRLEAAQAQEPLKECISRLEAVQAQEPLKECISRLEAMQEQEALKECISRLEAMQAQEPLKECISRLEAMQEQEEPETLSSQELAQIRELLDEKFKQSDDFLHRENVKVYRNVQAAMTEELSKHTEELKKSQIENRGSRAVLPIAILILIGVIADILIKLFAIVIPM
ncbi:MAG: hypothetical protein K2O65_06400 [Lachnospiraceae bacterium]|nr:hypothetical protein [Lachnospiraceae bacterium]